jgi:myo-inositol-1(or 4)-monophosphatase
MTARFKEVAIGAALLAGTELRTRYREKGKEVVATFSHDVKLKDDLDIQQLIVGYLRSEFPDHGFLGEEGSRAPTASEYVWVIDPIDGTVNYSQGIAHFSTSLALQRSGETIVGVVYDPVAEDLFAAATGEAPTLNGHEIVTSARTDLSECVMSFGMARRTGEGAIAPEILSMVPLFRKARVFGCASLALSYVACGRLDAYFEEVLHTWDIAAGVSIVEAAGGRVLLTDLGGGRRAVVAHNGRLPLSEFDRLSESV